MNCGCGLLGISVLYNGFINYRRSQGVFLWVARVRPCGSISPLGAETDSPTPALEEFLGAEGKVVWIQSVNEQGDRDPFMITPHFKVLGQSTSDGAPVELLPGPAAYRRPLMIPDGSGVIVSDLSSDSHLHIDWNSPGAPASTVPKIALEVWQDPTDKKIWVYVGSDPQKGPQLAFSKVERYVLGEIDTLEEVWNRRLSLDNFQLSGNGDRFAALFPWPHAGIGSFEGEGSWEKYLHGCWPSLAPDNSGLAWVFDGAHRNLQMFHRDPDLRWNVAIDEAAELKGQEMYHPRWANHPNFISVSGPYRKPEGTIGTVIGQGGAGVEIYLGKFSSSLDKMESMFRLTNNDRGDFAPDLWIQGGETESLNTEKIIAGKPEGSPISASVLKHWPLPGALFQWQSARSKNEVKRENGEPPLSCQLTLRDGALLGPHYELSLGDGTAEASSEIARHVVNQIAASGEFTVEFTGTTRDYGDRPDAVLLEIGDEDHGPLLQIAQRIGSLSYTLRTSASGADLEFSQGSVPIWLDLNAPTHLAVRFKGNEISILPDGQNWCQDVVQGDLSIWKNCAKPYLILGSKRDGSARWKGGLENVAIYPRQLTDTELMSQSASVLKNTYEREAPPRAEVLGKLIKMAPMPAVEDLGAYQRSFVSYEYEITKVHGGEFKPGRVEVRHYAILDRRRVNGLPREIGKSYMMSLEPWEAHPQAASDRISELEGELSLLPVYIDVRHHMPKPKTDASGALPENVSENLQKTIKESATSDTRIVWIKDARPAAPGDISPFRELWGFDTATNEAPVKLSDAVRCYSQPRFSKDGSEVWFYDAAAERSYALDWETRRLSELGKGRKSPEDSTAPKIAAFSHNKVDIFVNKESPIRVTKDDALDIEPAIWTQHESGN